MINQFIHGGRSSWLLLLLLSGLLWTFVQLAVVVMEGESQALDESIIIALRSATDLSDPLGPRWFEELMRDVTGLGGTGILTFLTLCSASYLMLRNKPRMALYVLIAVVTGMLVSFGLKYGFTRPRPDLVPHGSYVYTSSFPSGHSMMAALVYFTLATIVIQVQSRIRVRALIVIAVSVIVVSVGVSRVYLGVHWPTDVLAGWCAGVFWALMCYRVLRMLQKRQQLESSTSIKQDSGD